MRNELRLHDLLIFQLDHELTYHQFMVKHLKDQLSMRIRKSGELTEQVEELSEAVKCLRKEKLELLRASL